jgi:hypothetical protein
LPPEGCLRASIATIDYGTAEFFGGAMSAER